MTAPSLPDFLLQRIAEDEAAACAESAYGEPGTGSTLLTSDGTDANGWTLASPARILATCAAHREIIRIHLRDWKNLAEQHGRDAEWVAKRVDGDWVLCALASIYADHPEFRAEWERP